MWRSARLRMLSSCFDNPCVAVACNSSAIGISCATSALALGVSSTATSRLLRAERARLTSPICTSRVIRRDKVDTSVLVISAISV